MVKHNKFAKTGLPSLGWTLLIIMCVIAIMFGAGSFVLLALLLLAITER